MTGAIRVNNRDVDLVRNEAIHIALGVRADGTENILIAVVVDGLNGFPEAIMAVFPETVVQTSIVQLLRNSMDFVS